MATTGQRRKQKKWSATRAHHLTSRISKKAYHVTALRGAASRMSACARGEASEGRWRGGAGRGDGERGTARSKREMRAQPRHTTQSAGARARARKKKQPSNDSVPPRREARRTRANDREEAELGWAVDGASARRGVVGLGRWRWASAHSEQNPRGKTDTSESVVPPVEIAHNEHADRVWRGGARARGRGRRGSTSERGDESPNFREACSKRESVKRARCAHRTHAGAGNKVKAAHQRTCWLLTRGVTSSNSIWRS